MVTRNQDGTRKTTQHLNLHVSHTSPIPKSMSLALSDPYWQDSIYDAYNTLIKNGTWVLVPRPPSVNIVRCLWLFRHKFHADGSFSRYKARLVANGSSQLLGIDCEETFSPVVKPKSHYFVVTQHILIYVNDIVLTSSSTTLLQNIIFSLHREFDMTDLSAFNYFLRIFVTRDTTGVFLSQKRYVMELLERAHISTAILLGTPCWGTTESMLKKPEGSHISEFYFVSYCLDRWLQLYASTRYSLVAYSDTDWVGATSKSTSGYCVFMGNNKRQPTLSRPSA
ncbi:ribonuclease H-like domain-containing protein [Tanacetum coccineum]